MVWSGYHILKMVINLFRYEFDHLLWNRVQTSYSIYIIKQVKLLTGNKITR